MGDPSGHWKSSAKSGELENGPRTLEKKKNQNSDTKVPIFF